MNIDRHSDIIYNRAALDGWQLHMLCGHFQFCINLFLPRIAISDHRIAGFLHSWFDMVVN